MTLSKVEIKQDFVLIQVMSDFDGQLKGDGF